MILAKTFLENDAQDKARELLQIKNYSELQRITYMRECWENYLMYKGYQYSPNEKKKNVSKGLLPIPHNILSRPIEQKVAMITNFLDSPDFEIVSGNTDTQTAIMAEDLLRYTWYNSDGSQAILRPTAEMTSVVGQHLLINKPSILSDGSFCVTIEQYPFYSYVPIGTSRDYNWKNLPGVIYWELKPLLEVSRLLHLNKEEREKLYVQRYQFNDFYASSVQGTGQANTFFQNIIQSEQFKHLFHGGNVFQAISTIDTTLDTTRKEYLYYNAIVPVVTMIETETDTRKIFEIYPTDKQRAWDIQENTQQKSPLQLPDKPPVGGYLHRRYFDKSQEWKLAQESIREDVNNGYTVIKERDMYCKRILKTYGNYCAEEEIHALDLNPFTPVTYRTSNDTYALGDVAPNIDHQRLYNETQILIQTAAIDATNIQAYATDGNFDQNDLQDIRLGKKNILKFERKDIPPNQNLFWQELKRGVIPPDVVETNRQRKQEVELSIIGNEALLGAQQPQSRTELAAKIKEQNGNVPIQEYQNILTHAFSKHLQSTLEIYHQESPLNMMIQAKRPARTGNTSTIANYNETTSDPQTHQTVIKNEVMFDLSHIKVSFGNAIENENEVVAKFIAQALPQMPPTDPLYIVMFKALMVMQNNEKLLELMQEADALKDPMAKAAQLAQQNAELTAQLQGLQQELQQANLDRDFAKIKQQKVAQITGIATKVQMAFKEFLMEQKLYEKSNTQDISHQVSQLQSTLAELGNALGDLTKETNQSPQAEKVTPAEARASQLLNKVIPADIKQPPPLAPPPNLINGAQSAVSLLSSDNFPTPVNQPQQ